MKTKKVTINKGSITYYTSTIQKSKNTLFFIHGLTSWGLTWQQSYDYFKKEYNIILLDLPGHGTSSHTKHPIRQSVKVIVSILKKEGIRKAHFVGQCIGPYILLPFYKEYPQQVRSLIFVGPNYKNPTMNYYKNDWSLFTMPFRAIIKAYSIAYFFHSYTRPKHVPIKDYIEGKKNIWRLYTKDMLATMPNTMYSYYKDMLSSNHTLMLKDVNVPVLLLVGKNDTVFPPRIARDMHKQLPKSTLKILNGDHSIAIKKPLLLNKTIASFLHKLT